MLTLLRNASVYAPESVGRVDILLADRRIAAIEPELPALPQSLPHVVHDLTDHPLIPGLIDAHVHMQRDAVRSILDA